MKTKADISFDPYWSKLGAGFLVISICFFSAGCIRIAGKTGFWYKGSKEEPPKVKQVGFDTQDLVQRDQAPGSIEI
jgi:hypothetical protein